MSLPTIAPYALPTEAELPPNRVGWRPEPHRALLLVHDMQNHWLDRFTAGAAPLTEVLENINTLRKHAADLGIPVVFSAQPGGQAPEQRGLLQDFWGDGLPADARAEAIVDELAPSPGEVVLTKRRYSAFTNTGLRDLLGNRDQLIVTGVYGHIGVHATVLDAFVHDIQPFVVADAIADFSAEDHRRTLRHVADRCGLVLPTSRLVAELAPVFTLDVLRARVQELLDEPAADDDNLFDAGLDSIRLMALVVRWRAAGLTVSLEDLAEQPTIRGWAGILGATP